MPTPQVNSVDANGRDGTNEVYNNIVPPTPVNNESVPRLHLQIQGNIEELTEPINESHIIQHPVDSTALVQVKIARAVIPNNIFPFQCLPYTDLRPEACRFKSRGCLIRTWGLKDPSIRERFNSISWYNSNHPMVFPVPIDKYKNGLELADTKLVLCSNTECTRVNGDSIVAPTAFHYCCYANMIKKETVNHLTYEETDDHFTDHQQELIESLKDVVDKNTVILPICGKKCYNTILRRRQARIEKENKEKEEASRKKDSIDCNSSLIRWDSDSRDGSLTSEAVIVEWLTDEDRAEMYFGGNHGYNNTVSGTRKDSYHKNISHKILRTNGTFVITNIICHFHILFLTF